VETVRAKDLTIGVCHSAYQIEPVIRERWPEVSVFQTFNTEAMQSMQSMYSVPGMIFRLFQLCDETMLHARHDLIPRSPCVNLFSSPPFL
jgi:hypothetical protein